MSQYIVLSSWSGKNPKDATQKVAKIFRMSPKHATIVMDQLAKGTSWQFEHTISDKQAPVARAFLEKLGFSIEILDALASSNSPDLERGAKGSSLGSEVVKEFSDRMSRVELEDKVSSSLPSSKWLGELEPPTSFGRAESSSAGKKGSFLGRLGFTSKREVGASPQRFGAQRGKFWFGKIEKKTPPAEEELTEPFRIGFSAKQGLEKETRSSLSLLGMFFLFILVLLGAATLVLPYWVGKEIETRFNNLPLLVSGPGIQWVNKGFKRDWFKSSAETILKLKGSSIKISLIHNISHGPVLVDNFLHGDPEEHLNRILTGEVQDYLAIASIISEIKQIVLPIGILGPLSINTKVGFKGEFQSNYEIKPLEEIDNERFSFRWDGLEGESSIPKDGDIVLGSFQVLPFRLSLGSLQATVEGVQIIINLQRQTSGKYSGSFKWNIDQLKIEDPKIPVTFKGIQLTQDFKEINKALQSMIRLDVNAFKTRHTSYGPGIIIFKIRNMDANSIIKLRNFISSRNSANREEQKKQLHVLNDLAKRSPELEISKFQLTGPTGSIEGRAKFQIDGLQVDLDNNFFSIFYAFRAKVDVSAPKPFFEHEYTFKNNSNPLVPNTKIRLPVENFLEKGYLQAEGNKYTTSVLFENGKLKLNGKQFDPFSPSS